MIQLIDLLCRSLRWLRRFRKRCGYGIHSPFAYNLVSGVIYEKGEYYCYEQLSSQRTKENAVLREKDDRLLFRLIIHCSPVNGFVICPKIGITADYFRAGCSKADWQFLQPDALNTLPELLAHTKSIDFIYIDDAKHTQRILNMVLPYVHDHTLIIIHHIRHNSALFEIWQLLLQQPAVRVSFDLHDFGLVYFEHRLNKENYIINYF